MVRRIAVLAFIALAGCRQPIEPSMGARFDVLARSYTPGEPLTARLTNGSPYRLAYNLCFSALERREANGWITANPAFGLPAGTDACALNMETLEPGASVDYRPTVPWVAVATYRLRTEIELGVQPASTRLTLTTPPFVISWPMAY